MGHFTVDVLLMLQAVIGFLLLYDNVSRFLSLVRAELTQRGAKYVASWLAYFVPALNYREEVLNRRYPYPPPHGGTTTTTTTGGNTTIGGGGDNHNGNHVQTQTDDFKVRINGTAMMIEILDGGLCLEEEDNICQEESPIQRAIATALFQTSISSHDPPVNRLELVASFMRADLNNQMVSVVLQRLPRLQFLQLGGISLTVQDMTRILRHPSLRVLKNITLCDVEFLLPRNPDIVWVNETENDEEEEEETSFQSTNIPLQLRKFVCLFARLEAGVTLDPLLEALQSALNLEQFELVMDHNHSYQHGQPRQPGVAAQSIFSHVGLAKVLQATRQLKILVLEYVPLNSDHLSAISTSLDHTDCQWHDLRLVNDKDSDCIADTDWTSLANVLQHRSTLQKLSLDGVTRDTHQVALLLERLGHNASIMDLRLRNLPLSVDSMHSLFSTNTTVQVLFLQCNTFDQAKEQDQVFALLVKVLKEQNTTLQRLNYKHALCARTEVFPRRRKPKRCYTERFTLLQKHKDDENSSWKLQQQIHWYLTLNERGIRQDRIMIDVSQSRLEFLQLLLDQQREEKSILGDKDSYDLDCVFHLMSSNPSLCSTTLKH